MCAQIDDENFLHVAIDEGDYQIFDLETHEKMGSNTEHEGSFHWLCVNHKNDKCAISDKEGSIILFNVSDRRNIIKEKELKPD